MSKPKDFAWHVAAEPKGGHETNNYGSWAVITELSIAVTFNVILDIPLISTVVHVEAADRVRNMWGNLTRWLEEVYDVDAAPGGRETLFSIPNDTPCPGPW